MGQRSSPGFPLLRLSFADEALVRAELFASFEAVFPGTITRLDDSALLITSLPPQRFPQRDYPGFWDPLTCLRKPQRFSETRPHKS